MLSLRSVDDGPDHFVFFSSGSEVMTNRHTITCSGFPVTAVPVAGWRAHYTVNTVISKVCRVCQALFYLRHISVYAFRCPLVVS